MHRCVQKTDELLRIEKLPRRHWMADVDSLIDPLTAHLTLPGHVCKRNARGEVECAVLNDVPVIRLRRVQAAAIAEAHDLGGHFLQGGVGLGKTLISMLLGVALESDRIMLVIPAGLRTDTRDKFRVLRQHWASLPISLQSYEHFGRDGAKETLRRYFNGAKRPMLIFDEAQALKDRRAGCTRKIERFIEEWRYDEGRLLFVCAMSGTTAKRSLKDFRHIVRWCRPNGCPLPEGSDIDDWSLAIDEKVPEQSRIDPGALLRFCNEEEKVLAKIDPTTAATRAVGRRIFETPGVMATTEKGLDTPLVIDCVQVTLSKEEDEAFSYLRGIRGREDRLGWETPDRHPIGDAVALWRHARELALGFFYRWDPRPPLEWLYARQAWCAAVRDILGHNQRELDTEFQVADEVRRAVRGRVCPVCKARTTELVCKGGEEEDFNEEADRRRREGDAFEPWGHPPAETKPDPKHHEAKDEYEKWQAIKDTFEPNTVPVWVGSTALEFAADWGRKNTGIIWTEHRAFAERLAQMSGLRYYGRGGLDARGQQIEKADPAKSLIASISSNHKGRNLQAWNRSLVTSFPPTGTLVEQMLGREHRPGQRAPEVRYDVLIACREQLAGFEQARRDCTWHKHLLTTEPKLSFAAVHVPIIQPTGYAWAPQQKNDKERRQQVDARLESLRPTG